MTHWTVVLIFALLGRSSQLTEIAPFRLTRPFDLAYTRFTASFGEFLAIGRRCFSADADWSSPIIISLYKNRRGHRLAMNFLARLIRFLFWVVIVSWGVRVAGRLISGLLQPGQRREPLTPTGDLNAEQAARLLVRDPICGVHIAETLAISLRENGELLHFCSLACRDVYLNSSHKLAANA